MRKVVCLRNHSRWPKLMRILLPSSGKERMIMYWQSWKSCHEKNLNREFAWDVNILSLADGVSGVPCLMDKDMARE